MKIRPDGWHAPRLALCGTFLAAAACASSSGELRSRAGRQITSGRNRWDRHWRQLDWRRGDGWKQWQLAPEAARPPGAKADHWGDPARRSGVSRRLFAGEFFGLLPDGGPDLSNLDCRISDGTDLGALCSPALSPDADGGVIISRSVLDIYVTSVSANAARRRQCRGLDNGLRRHRRRRRRVCHHRAHPLHRWRGVGLRAGQPGTGLVPGQHRKECSARSRLSSRGTMTAAASSTGRLALGYCGLLNGY